MLTLTFHGHACFTLEADGRRVIIDPFLTGNPATDIPLARLPKIDAVLLSHGHGDHLGDAIPIARRDGATIIATAELARFCGERGATVHAMHIGGAREFAFGRVKLVPAFRGGRHDGWAHRVSLWGHGPHHGDAAARRARGRDARPDRRQLHDGRRRRGTRRGVRAAPRGDADTL